MLNHIVIRESQVKLETNVNHTVAARVRVVMKLKAKFITTWTFASNTEDFSKRFKQRNEEHC